MSEELLDRMGNYFVYFNIRDKYDISFHDFMFLIERNLWEEFKIHRGLIG